MAPIAPAGGYDPKVTPMSIATISSGFEKGDFLVREEKGQRVVSYPLCFWRVLLPTFIDLSVLIFTHIFPGSHHYLLIDLCIYSVL